MGRENAHFHLKIGPQSAKCRKNRFFDIISQDIAPRPHLGIFNRFVWHQGWLACGRLNWICGESRENSQLHLKNLAKIPQLPQNVVFGYYLVRYCFLPRTEHIHSPFLVPVRRHAVDRTEFTGSVRKSPVSSLKMTPESAKHRKKQYLAIMMQHKRSSPRYYAFIRHPWYMVELRCGRLNWICPSGRELACPTPKFASKFGYSAPNLVFGHCLAM